MKWQVRRFYSGDWDKPWGWTDWRDAPQEEAAGVIAANRPDIQARQIHALPGHDETMAGLASLTVRR